MPRKMFLFVLMCLMCFFPAMATPLDDYVAAPDSNYSYTVDHTVPGVGYTLYYIKMNSQQWRTADEVNHTLWKHWLLLLLPTTIRSETGILIVEGGNRNDAPLNIDEYSSILGMVSNTLGAPIAYLQGVPNEPLTFADEPGRSRTEDAIIAYSFDKFMKTGDSTWPVLLPMVKSVVRAMDTIQTVVATDRPGQNVEDFLLGGASKRGWTTWLTAAVDSRVRAMMPLVIDILNMDVQMAHHYGVYGQYSSAIRDYVQMHVFDRLNTPEGKALIKIVDPYEYRGRYENIRKLIACSTGDQFFVSDSSQFYYHDTPGEKRLRYIPNTGHGLAFDAATIPFLLSFFAAVLDDRPLPEYGWAVESDGTIRAKTKDTPLSVKLWQATNPSKRDFRLDVIGSAWTSTEILPTTKGADGWTEYAAKPATPPQGWTAYFIEFTYPESLWFTTEIHVTPDTIPYMQANTPTADFSAESRQGAAPRYVQFTDLSASSSEYPIVEWLWNFGDGNVSAEANPTHTYTQGGDYTVSLRVRNAVQPAYVARPAYIKLDPPVPPTASFVFDRGADTGQIRFQDDSVQGSSPILSWDWNFGDGQFSDEQHPEHVFADPGTYDVTLTVTSEAGSDEYTLAVEVAPPVPMTAAPLAFLAACATGVCFLLRRRNG